MKIFDSIKKIFVSEKTDETSSSPDISIDIDDNFSNDPEMLKLIDKYNNEYLRIISSKDIESLAIKSIYYFEDVEMNIKLIMKILFTLNEDKEIKGKEKIDYLINKEKIDLYITTLTQLEREITARLIALYRLYKERGPYPDEHFNNALLNELEFLNSTLKYYYSKKLAIEYKRYKYLEHESFLDDEESDHLLSQRRELLQSILESISPTEETLTKNKINIRENKEHIYMDIARVEKMIEEYVYNHKKEADTLKFDSDILWNFPLDYTNKESLLATIEERELSLLTFYYYGIDYIGIEDLMELYLLKFNVLTLCDDGICDVFVNDDTNDIELNCYIGIVQREIEALLNGETSYDDPKMVNVIIKILKNGKDHIDFKEVLTNRYLLNILLSMDSRPKLINLLKNFKVKKDDYDCFDFCEEMFEWEDEVPLETVYRLMSSQGVEKGNELFELLRDFIYPDKNLYYLPVGLKAINYLVDKEVEKNWLNTTTLNTLNKARELMSRKEVIIPTSLIRIKNGNQFFDPSIKRLLFPEGLQVDMHDMLDIEVVGRLENKITYWDKTKKEIITSDLHSRIDNKWGDYDAAGLIIQVPAKDLFIEEYNQYRYSTKSSEKAMSAIDAREDDDSLLLRRAYADVHTKYGYFCIHIEEKYVNYGYGKYRSISLYHGDHKNIMVDWKNDFDFPEYCLFRSKYDEKTKFYQWIVGYSPNIFSNPKTNIWRYDQSYNGTVYLYAPIYSVESRVNTNRGVIFLDGKMRVSSNEERVPEMLDNIKINEYEHAEYTSKAYFGNPSEHIAILKDGFRIEIIYKKRNRRTDEWEEKFHDTIASDSAKEFDKNDLLKIIEVIRPSNIDQEIKMFTINQILTYINLHYRNACFNIGAFPADETINLGSILKHADFYELLDILERYNITEYVEKLIETLSQGFEISIEDLLGNVAINNVKKKDPQKTLKKK